MGSPGKGVEEFRIEGVDEGAAARLADKRLRRVLGVGSLDDRGVTFGAFVELDRDGTWLGGWKPIDDLLDQIVVEDVYSDSEAGQ